MPSKQILICTRTHGDIQVFHCNFADFANFEDFNCPEIQEGAVCSTRLYGMNSGGDCGLEFRRNRFRFAQGLMEIKVSVGVGLKIAESGTFLLPLREAVAVRGNGGRLGFSASNRCIYPLQGRSNCRLRGLWAEV